MIQSVTDSGSFNRIFFFQLQLVIIHSFSHSFKKCWSAVYVPETILDAENVSVKETEDVPSFLELSRARQIPHAVSELGRI